MFILGGHALRFPVKYTRISMGNFGYYLKTFIMKKTYYVNKNEQRNGDHEVHADGCSWMPNPENKQNLGEFSNCQDAVKEAKKTFPQSNGCKYCCTACHTS
jgi:hypothetical protein